MMRKRFEVERNFSLWQRRAKDLLGKEGLLKMLHDKADKPHDMPNVVWENIYGY